MPSPVIIDFENYAQSVPKALDAVGAAAVFTRQKAILLKPNLVNLSPHPVTTPAKCCEAVVQYIRACSQAAIVIGEGCGEPSVETTEIFQVLDYVELAQRYGIQLIDLNHAPLRKLRNPQCRVFSEMYLPEIAFTHYLVSIPVLKAHSFSVITGTLKNMMGLAPPAHYSDVGGHWRKSAFHPRMHEAILDLNRYRTPDLTLLDASIGLAEYHLGGATCNPPVRKLVAGFDPVEVDRVAADLLGMDWRKISHLKDKGR